MMSHSDEREGEGILMACFVPHIGAECHISLIVEVFFNKIQN